MSVEVSKEADKTYYSTISSSKDHADEEGDAALQTIATATLTGGDENVKYKCTAQLTVSVKESEAISTIQFKEGDAVLKLVGDSGVTATDNLLNTEIDLSTLIESGYTKSGTVTFDLTGATADDSVKDSKNIKAYLAITNKKKVAQNADSNQTERLAGKEFTVEVKAENFTCDTVA